MFKKSEAAYYMMPAHFGAWAQVPGPAAYHDVRQVMMVYETDRGPLEELVPDLFECVQPWLVVAYAMSREVDWLAGGGYNLVQVGVPVAYVDGRERIEGIYVLVIWENKTIPILLGREQTGMPKTYADISDCAEAGGTLTAEASYDGRTFLALGFRASRQLSHDDVSRLNERTGRVNAFGWRHVPNIGRAGSALSHATLFPQDCLYTEAWVGEGRVEWTALKPEQYPLHGVITERLGALPIKGYRECMMTRGSAVLRNDLARQLRG